MSSDDTPRGPDGRFTSRKPEDFRILLPALKMLDKIQQRQGQPAALAVWERAERDAMVAGDHCITEQHVRKAIRAVWYEAQQKKLDG